MSKNTVTDPIIADSADEWEDIKVGLGEEWDLEDAPITGVFMGMETLEVPDTNNPGSTRETNAYRIEVAGDQFPNRFIWGSYNLDLAMKEVQVGDMVRVTYIGTNSFKDDNGRPKSVKAYRVQKKKA